MFGSLFILGRLANPRRHFLPDGTTRNLQDDIVFALGFRVTEPLLEGDFCGESEIVAV